MPYKKGNPSPWEGLLPPTPREAYESASSNTQEEGVDLIERFCNRFKKEPKNMLMYMGGLLNDEDTNKSLEDTYEWVKEFVRGMRVIKEMVADEIEDPTITIVTNEVLKKPSLGSVP